MRFAPAPIPEPVYEMNTTPLIDVLLVLLVMLIITIPPATHAVRFDLPADARPRLPVNPHSNLLTIDAAGTLRWNDAVISPADLKAELAASRQFSPAPELHLQPTADARHGDVDDTLAII